MSLTAIVYLLCFLAGLGAALVRHPIYGLYTYVAVFYLDAPGRWWGADLPDLRWSMLAAVVTFLGMFIHRQPSQRKRWISHTPVVFFCLFVALMWIQWPWVVTGEDHAYGLNIFTKYVLVIYLMYVLLDTRERIMGFMFAHALGALYLGYLAYTSYSGGRLDGVGGPGIDDANSLGMQMSTAAYAGAALFLSLRGWKRWIGALSVAFALNVVVMAGSRGGLLAFLAAGLAFFLFRPRGTLMIAVACGLGALVLLGSLASEFFIDRIKTIGVAVENAEEADESAYSRLVIIESQWEIAKDHPLGVGHRGTAALSYTYIPIEYHASQGGRSSHNTLMSALVDQGFLGLFLWLMMLTSLALMLFRQKRYERSDDQAPRDWLLAAIAAGHASIFVGGMFAPFIRAEVFIWYLALAASLASLRPEPVMASSPVRHGALGRPA